MPIYEYHCNSCQKDHEIIQNVNEPRLTICPACGGALEKKISASSFHLKGGGWYKDGYSSAASTEPKKTTEKTSTTSASSTESTAKTTESTPKKETPKAEVK